MAGSADDTITLRGVTLDASAVLQDRGIPLKSTLHATPAVRRPMPEGDPISLGRFQTLGEIGRGGMGRVLEANDPELGRTVAVKVLIDPDEVSDVQLARFAAEARITSQLEHPNIVPVYDMGATSEGLLFFVMKKVVGRSLREILDAISEGDADTARIWTLRRSLTTFVAVCNGVAFANDRGVLHRDIKPDNIMLGRYGEVLLMDWGVARIIGSPVEPLQDTQDTTFGSVPVTLDGVTVGTPGYMSPEQARADFGALDAPSDVFSLGAVLYELLTHTRAFRGDSVYATLFAAMSGATEDPRQRAPERRIPDELAEVCLRALAHEPADRYPTAAALAAAIEEFLEGSKRREAAASHLVEAEAAWTRYRATIEEREKLELERRRLETEIEPWRPIEEKRALLEVWERIGTLGPASADAFSELIAGCEAAMSQDPGNPAARELLARAHYARFEEAESAGDAVDQAYFRRRVLAHDDDGRFAALITGVGAITLRTDPAGAEVICARFDRRGLLWTLVEPRDLGATPLERVPLEPGSWLLTVTSPGRAPMRYPVYIPRGHHWDGGEEPIPLLAEGDLGPGERYVPAGPFGCGGDPDAPDSLPAGDPWVPGFIVEALPVTVDGWCDFVNTLQSQDPEEAWSRVPRVESGIKTADKGHYWERPADGERYRVPEVDRDGDRWDGRWPVFGISWADAVAYAAVRAEHSGQPWRLLPEGWWEKAARGVDRRAYPWGDRLDASLCKMKESRAGVPRPEPVGAFAGDLSVYGMQDTAGGLRDWCAEEHFDGDPDRRVVRGGAWASAPAFCRSAWRGGMSAWAVSAYVGLRLCRPIDS